MRIGSKIGTGVIVLGLVLGTAQAAGARPQATSRAGIGTVTLITGDRVTVQDGRTLSVRPGEGREGTAFSRFTAGGHSYVIPADARQLIAAGRVDRRLFDITTLIEFGYDDAHRDTVPLIVTHPAGRTAPRLAAADVSRELPSINGVAVTAGKDDAGAVWEALTDGDAVRTTAAGVSKVWLDGKRKSTLDRSTAQINAPAAWDNGLTGDGVRVAVLDTGVDQTHPDLADREVAEQNFSDSPDNVDRFGHGTHVASIVAGTGAKSDGKYRGVAHGASILDGKVLDDFGSGFDSSIVAGMEWAAEQGADIVNLSLGGPDNEDVDPIEEAVASLTDRFGTLFVIAAGNSGPGAKSVGSPGSAPAALSVGAVERTDELAEFSSRGPTAADDVIKPDVTAPGVEIVAALHSAGTINAPVADGYTPLSGTSMATPHVAGAAALLAQLHPDWTGPQLKAVLSGSARPNPGLTSFEQGAGRIDVARALDQTVVSEPTGVNLGTIAWPHEDDEPVSRTVTYRNLGDQDVTLDLALTATGPDGDPAGVFSLSAEELTVPAGGTAPVTVTADTNLGQADGLYSGLVVATSGDSVTNTPVAVTREPESYDLTLNVTDENGAPTGEFSTLVVGLDNFFIAFLGDEDGSVSVRLPKGRYLADNLVLTEQGERWNSIVRPGIQLDRDVTVDVAATAARPLSVTPPADATPLIADIGYELKVDGAPLLGLGLLVEDVGTVSTALVGGVLPGTSVSGWISTQWTGADEALYALAWFLDEYPTGFTRTVRRHELATVHTAFGPGAEGAVGVPFLFPLPASGDAIVGGIGFEVPLPSSRTVFVNTRDLRWQQLVLHLVGTGDFLDLAASFAVAPRAYRQGRTYRERVGFPVFGPAQPPSDSPWVSRSADTITVDIPMFSDGDGNAGSSLTESAATRLFRGAELVAETPEAGFGQFTGLPAEPARYRLTTEAVRPDLFDLTTSVSAEWTFSSAEADGTKEIGIDVVRFLPELADDGTAPAGRRFLVPLRFQDVTGEATRPKRITVEVSYDEGGTWQRVPVRPDLVAELRHPADADSVSLRASAADRNGNTVDQTIIRAYRLR